MRGDCSVRTEGFGFTGDEIAACAEREGLLSFEIDLPSEGPCRCANCKAAADVGEVLILQEILGAIDQALTLGARRCILVDGDENQYRDLRNLIDEIHLRRMDIELFTKGSRITDEDASFLCQRRVSLVLSTDPALHPLTLEQSVVDRLKSVGYCRPDSPPVALRIKVCDENIEKITGTWRWARTQGIAPYVQIVTPSENGNGNSTLPSSGAIRQLFEDLGEIDTSEFHREWKLPPSLTGRSCKRHLFACHMTPCGNIHACVGITISLGNIRSEPLREILQLSEVLENLRAYGQFVKEPCRTCSQGVDCYGCRGSAYQLTGDYLAGDQLCWKADGAAIESLPTPAEYFIPHGESMRVVDQLVQIGERRSQTEYLVEPRSPFVDERGRLDELAFIEMIAQSFAATHGFHLSPHQRGRQRGFLLGVKDFRISGEARLGDRLIISIYKVTRFGDFGVVEGQVRQQNGTMIASAEVKIWRATEKIAGIINS